MTRNRGATWEHCLVQERIAIIGVGRMGAPIAARLLAGGHRVTAYDLDGARLDAAVAGGAIRAGSIAEAAAGADIVLTVLPGPPEARGALLDDGCIDAMPSGSLWLDLTSNDPRVATRIAALAAAAGIASVGAPMGGGPGDAAAGTLRFYTGGAAADIDRVVPVLALLAREDGIVRTGARIADGYTAKLLVNHLWFGQAIAVTESMLLAQSLGIAPGTFRDALVGSAGESAFTTGSLDRLLAGDYLESFGIDRVVEELDTVVALAEETGTPFALSTLVGRIHRDALERYGAVDGELLAAKLLEEQAGSTLRAD